MKANRKIMSRLHGDENAVSPVIAVILMVAITVVLAATVYVWVSGFSATQSQNEQASATAKGESGAIRVLLTQGGQSLSTNGDYPTTAYTIYVDGTEVGNPAVCTGDAGDAGLPHFQNDKAAWSPGQPLTILACDVAGDPAGEVDSGDHIVTVVIAGTTIFDGKVRVT